VDDDQKPQVISRAAALLRAVAACAPEGGTTTGLARTAELPRPTAHRLLVALAEQGLVDRDHRTGRWSLGPELYLLGSLAAHKYDITHHAVPVLRELARETGESAFLSARRGDETVCIASEEGSFPLRSHVLHIGIRFPLGVASAGLAILAHLPRRELEKYLARTDLPARWGESHGTGPLSSRLAEVRANGYATNPGLIIEGSWGMAAAVFDHRDEPAWAISVTGVETRFSTERRGELGPKLVIAAHTLSRSLQRITGG